jgi:excisionase family DNA binding protein
MTTSTEGRGLLTEADKFITLRAAGDRIGVSRWTIRERVRAGLLPAYRTGPGSEWRVKVSDVDALLTRVQPTAAQTDQRD